MYMTQVKIFSETTYEDGSRDALTITKLEDMVNKYLEDNKDKITVKDIKYTIQSPNPHQTYNLRTKNWTVMIIYDKL